MELILGLPPMTQYDALATPMYNVFTTEAVLAAYTHLPARVDLLARNPETGGGRAAFGAARLVRIQPCRFRRTQRDPLDGAQRRSADASAGAERLAGSVSSIYQ
jgi:hypothetical protein